MSGFVVRISVHKAGGVSMEREGDTHGSESVFVPDPTEDPAGHAAAVLRIWELYSPKKQEEWIKGVEEALKTGPLGGINNMFNDLLGPKSPHELREQAIEEFGKQLVNKYGHG